MSSATAIEATINGKALAANATLSTDFLLNVAVNDAFFRDGKRHQVVSKDWLLGPDGEVINIGLIIKDA